MRYRHRFWASCLCAAAIALPALAAASDWPMSGRTLDNLADNAQETIISRDNVPKLALKWVAATGGDVSARAAIVDGVAYFPDWGGNIWALDTKTGKPLWHHTLSSYGFPSGTLSRTTPAVQGDRLYIGTQQGAYMIALDRETGAMKWRSQIDSHPQAIVTTSAAITNGVLYAGVASNEESAAANPAYPCCSFRGSAVAIDAQTGQIIWKTYTVPVGYTGGSIWGSNPVVDVQRQLVFIGTGNNYSTPADHAFTSCVAAGNKTSKCFSKEDHFDSILALNMANGHVKWARRLSNSDDWNVACFSAPSGTDNCPTGSGPDYDFGSAPQLITFHQKDGTTKTILGAGQKSGVYSTFDPDTGKMLWAKQVGPGASLGGIEWGSASDGQRIYVAISNSNGIRYAAGKAGSWNALDPATGEILWRTPDPNGAIDLGPMTVTNGVVYAPSMGGAAGQANMFALDAKTGVILWSFGSGSSVNAGASIVDGVVYWGAGYARFAIPGFTGNTKFFAFSPDGK